MVSTVLGCGVPLPAAAVIATIVREKWVDAWTRTLETAVLDELQRQVAHGWIAEENGRYTQTGAAVTS